VWWEEGQLGSVRPSLPTNEFIAAMTVRTWARSLLVAALGVGCAVARPLDEPGASGGVGASGTCGSLDCPRYDVIAGNDGYEIRKYEAGVSWAVARMEGMDGFEAATTAGFKELFLYISGVNWGARRMAMTAPVRTRVLSSTTQGLRGESESAEGSGAVFEVGFMAPYAEQAREGGPPAPFVWAEPHARLSADEPAWCVGVRVFGGWATDDVVVREAAILADDLRADDLSVDAADTFTVLQYNSPYETTDRTTEVAFVLPNDACVPKDGKPSTH